MYAIRSYYVDSTIGDLLEDENAMKYVDDLLKNNPIFQEPVEEEGAASKSAITLEMKKAMFQDMPIRGALSFGDGSVSAEDP